MFMLFYTCYIMFYNMSCSVSILQKAFVSSLTRLVTTLTQAFCNCLRKAFCKSYTKDNKNVLHNF